MKVRMNINGFHRGTDELVFDRTFSLPLEAVWAWLDPEVVGDDTGLTHTYAITEEAIRDIIPDEDIPEADWFVGQVQHADKGPTVG